MLSKLLSRTLPAIVAGFAFIALAGSAEATNNTNWRKVILSCAAGQDFNNDIFHFTRIQIRNITGQNNVFVVKSIKIYGGTGALLKNIPASTPFPVGFVTNTAAHAASVFATSDFFDATSPSLLTIVLEIQLYTSSVPYHIQAVSYDRDPELRVVSRDANPCLEQKG